MPVAPPTVMEMRPRLDSNAQHEQACGLKDALWFMDPWLVKDNGAIPWIFVSRR